MRSDTEAYFTVGDAANFEEKLDDLQARLGVRRDSYVPVYYHYDSGMGCVAMVMGRRGGEDENT